MQIDKVPIIKSEWCMNKPLCKNLQNIDRNKTVKNLVYVSAMMKKYCQRTENKIHF